MINEKQEKRLLKFLQDAEGSAVQPEELKQVVNTILGIIDGTKAELEKEISSVSKAHISVKDGKDGKDGKPGPKGERGAPGPIGRAIFGGKGEDGEDGKDGSPDTPVEVRDKLETLKEGERLDKNAIRGITVSVVAPQNPEIGDLWVRL